MSDSRADGERRGDGNSLANLALSIEEGAHVYCRLGLREATLGEFLAAIEREGGPARLSEILAMSRGRVVVLIREAKRLTRRDPEGDGCATSLVEPRRRPVATDRVTDA